MPLPAGSIVLVSYRSLWQQQRIILTQTYAVVSDQGAGQPWERSQQLADTLAQPADAVLGQYLLCLPLDVTVQEVRAQVIFPVRYQPGVGVVGVPGTQTSAASTGNVALALTLKTQFAKRSSIANKHIGPIPASRIVNGAPVAIYRTTVDTLGSLMVQQFSQNVNGGLITMNPVIFHRGQGTNDNLLTWAVSDRIGTLRRRTLRVGE